VLVFCSGCSELVTVGFVDVDDVMGLPARGGSSWLGVASAARLAVDLAAALVEQDDTAWRRIRREATGRPGDAVDGLSQLAAVLSRMVDEARPLRALHEVAARVEVSAIEQELLELGRRATS
jgi:hypothetical protein